MIQNWGTGACGQPARPLAMSVSDSRNSAPPAAARGPARVAPSAIAVSSRL